jgi:uncharacterized protein
MKVRATDSARAVVVRVAASGRRDLVLVLGTGCCDSTAPFLYDRYYPGRDAVRVGEVGGVPILAPGWLAELYSGEDGPVIDVAEGQTNDSFSLESEHDCRLVLRSGPAPDRP